MWTRWKSCCDYIHRANNNKNQSAHRKELLSMISGELEWMQSNMDRSTRQLRHNAKKCIGNALDILCNVKGETFQSKQFEVIRSTRAQLITKFFRRDGHKYWKTVLYHTIFQTKLFLILSWPSNGDLWQRTAILSRTVATQRKSP